MSASRPSPTEGGHGRAGVSGARPFRLRAVVFDFDGTLTHPGALDFPAIKREIGCPPDQYLLEWILSLPSGETRDAATLALERFELAAAETSAPNEGAEALVRRLRAEGLAVGVLTRNGLSAVERALRGFDSLTLEDFDVVVTRDDGESRRSRLRTACSTRRRPSARPPRRHSSSGTSCWTCRPGARPAP